MRTMEQKRALFAYQKVQEIDRKTGDQDKKEYRSKIQKFPAMVQSCGLIQSIAFYEAKGGKDGEISHILKEWFDNSDLGFPWPANFQHNQPQLGNALAQLDTELYRMATREALAFLTWLKRAAEAILPED